MDTIWHDHPAWLREKIGLISNPWRFVPAHMLIVLLSLATLGPMTAGLFALSKVLPTPVHLIPIAGCMLLIAAMLYIMLLLPWRVLTRDAHVAFLCMFIAPWIPAAFI